MSDDAVYRSTITHRKRTYDISITFDDTSFYIEIDGKASGVDGTMELRWNRIYEKPKTQAELYFITGANRIAPEKEKYRRMRFFQTGIILFEKMMRTYPRVISSIKLGDLAQEQKIPRITHLYATTQRTALQKLFTNFVKDPNDSYYLMNWKKLAAAAKKGKIMKLWIAEKKKWAEEKLKLAEATE